VWKVVITKQAKKDLVNIYRAGLKSKFEKLVEEIKKDPYTSQCEKLWRFRRLLLMSHK